MGANAKGTLRRAQEQRESTRREQEYARQEIQSYYSRAKELDAASGTMLKDDLRRRAREARERDAEHQLLENMYKADKTRELTALKAEEEDRLATTLASRIREQEKSQREIQRLREQSDEIRELQEKIRTAKVSKERAMQVQEKALLGAQETEYKRVMEAEMGRRNDAAIQQERDFQQRRREQNIQGRLVLEEQIAERADLQRVAEEEAARERAMVDAVVARILEEDCMEAAARRDKRDETKAFIEEYLRKVDEQRVAKKLQEQAEEREIQEYWRVVKEREDEEKARQAARKEAADRIYDRLKRERESEDAAKEEEEYLINLLREEELELKRRAEDAARKAKQEAMRQNMMRENERQLAIKAEREAAMRVEEEEFKMKMLAKFAEDDRIEQMNAQKRRLRMQEHKREVERLVSEKRAMYERQKAEEEAQEAARRAEEQRKAGLIEVERQRLLLEAAELKDFLPKGVMRDAKDLEVIRQRTQDLSMGGSGMGRR